MTIAPLKRVTLVGLNREKRAILQGLQELGCLHLLPLRATPPESEAPVPPGAKAAREALRFLTDMPRRRRQVYRDPNFDVDAVVADALAVKEQLRVVSDRRDFLVNRIATLEPWGDIDFPPKEALKGRYLWFYVLPLREQKALMTLEIPWRIVRKDNRFAYAVLIAAEEPPAGLLPVPRTHVGSQPRARLQEQLEDTEVELEEVIARREALTRYIYLLAGNLARAEDAAALTQAEAKTLDDTDMVAIQGWAPVAALDALTAFADSRGLACLIEDPGPDDNPPTLLDQPESMAAGVDLALFYQVPNYRSWDPTLPLFASFAVFFAMILADAGYGLVLMIGLLVFWGRLGSSSRSRGYRRLGLALFGCTIVYGVMVGSYFGTAPPETSLLAAFQILAVDDFDTMMRLSIIIGIGHLVFANLMLAHARRRSVIALSSLGWAAILLGGLAIWLAPPDRVWRLGAESLIACGLLAVLLFSSARPVHSAGTLGLRLLDGLKGLTGLMSAFGDVLSYMRLFALGLASASLAMTFNDLARDVDDALPGLGLLVALLILLVGHGLNLGLSVISGVVHGLRLNFIEFYKWGLGEEGEVFRRFARKEINR